MLTEPVFQGSAVSKKADLLTELVSQNPAVSKNLDLLTEPVFQGLTVSKNADLLTELVSQNLAVSKNGDLLTGSRYHGRLIAAKMLTVKVEEWYRRVVSKSNLGEGQIGTIKVHPQRISMGS